MVGHFSIPRCAHAALLAAILLSSPAARAQTGGPNLPPRPPVNPRPVNLFSDLPPGINPLGAATTVQLPTFGVSIDAAGTLALKTIEDPTGALKLERLRAAQAVLPTDLSKPSLVRKVSLNRLEQALAKQLAAGEQPDEALRYLAGMQRIQYVFLLPETNDVVIAGPAEGWWTDPAGRVLGLTSGRPVLELADLVVALRAFPPGKPRDVVLGCTINPTNDGLERLVKFQWEIPRSIPQNGRDVAALQIARGMHDALGKAEIKVFGIPADTHFGQVLVEADYRMKLIGIGLERPPIKLASYLDLCDSAQHGTLQRWWFTPNYQCVRTTLDNTAMELVGYGVQLQTESKVVLPGGTLGIAGNANKPSEMFCEAFTKKYPELAHYSPVFAQLRNLIDLAIAAAYIQQQNFAERAGWRMELLGDEKKFAVQGQPTPREVPAAVNAGWKGNRLIAPAGGGVSIEPYLALDANNLLPADNSKLEAEHGRAGKPKDGQWWWD